MISKVFLKYFCNISFKIWIIIIKKKLRLDAWDYFCITGLSGEREQGGIKSSSVTNEGPALLWKYWPVRTGDQIHKVNSQI